MAKYEKGCTKTGGRQKGTPNKVTSDVREFIANIVDANREQIVRDLESLEPKDRLSILVRLVEFVIPKQTAMNSRVEIDKLSEGQINQIINSISL